MSVMERVERWGTRHLTAIIWVGIIASLVCMYLLPAVTMEWEVGCSVGAFLFLACCFYIYVRATVR